MRQTNSEELVELQQQTIDFMNEAHMRLLEVDGSEERQALLQNYNVRIGSLLAGRGVLVETVDKSWDQGLHIRRVDPFDRTKHRFTGHIFTGRYIFGEFFRTAIERDALIISRDENTKNFKVKRYYEVPIIGSEAARTKLQLL